MLLKKSTASALLLLVATVAMCAVATSRAARHECAHDRMQDVFAKDLARGPITESVAARRERLGFRAQAPQPVRIVFSTADLTDTSKHCTTAGQVVPDFAGGSVQCAADDILTAERRAVLTSNILPAALGKLSAALHLERGTSNIVVPQGACTHFTIPSSHSSDGVANADYVLYVAAAPTAGSTLAWAGGCRTDSAGRIIVGRANFGPKYLSWANASIQAENVATAVHELLHALGFSSASFTSGTIATSASLRGKSATVLTLPTLKSRFTSFIGCATPSSIPGVELEDEGGSGSAGSHFERRVLKEDIMTAAGGDKLSEMTLAAMQDLGHYTVDFTQAEPMTWGKNAGCGWVTSKCDVVDGGRGAYWCFDVSGAEACTKDLTAIGDCAVSVSSSVPVPFQYFANTSLTGPKFLDGCPYIQGYSNQHCNVARASNANEQIFGQYYGTNGRCFTTSGLIQNGYSPTQPTFQRCLDSRCTASGLVQLRVGGGTWETCTATGQQLSGFSGYKGSVTCPDAAVLCASFGITPGAPPPTPAPTSNPVTPPPPPTPTTTLAPGATAQPPTPAPPTPAPTTAAPPGPTLGPAPTVTAGGTIYETKGELRFSGLEWVNLVAARSADIDAAVRISMSILLGIPTTTITITRLGIGSLVVEYTINAAMGFETIDARLQAAITATGSTSWFAELAAVYASVTPAPTDSIALTYNKVDQRSQVCQWANLDGDTCYVVFAGAAVCLAILVLVILWACCCRKKKGTQTAEEANASAQARRNKAMANDPYNASMERSMRGGRPPRRERSAPMRTDGAATAEPPRRSQRGDRSRSRSGDRRAREPK